MSHQSYSNMTEFRKIWKKLLEEKKTNFYGLSASARFLVASVID